MNELIEGLWKEFMCTPLVNGGYTKKDGFVKAIQTACQAQRNACQRIVEDYGSHSELDSIEQLYEAIGNADIDEVDYLASKKPRYLLVRHFDTQPILTVPTIELAYSIVDKMKPWIVDIICLDVEHYSYMPDNIDIETIAKKNGYVSPITKADYE